MRQLPSTILFTTSAFQAFFPSTSEQTECLKAPVYLYLLFMMASMATMFKAVFRQLFVRRLLVQWELHCVTFLNLFKIFLLVLWQLFIFLHLYEHIVLIDFPSLLFKSISMCRDWSVIWKIFLFTRMWLTF